MIIIIEGIMQMGEVLKSDDPIINFIEELQPTRRKKQLHVLKFNFLLQENKLEINVNEEMDNKTVEKYVYVGSADGTRSPQWYVSSTSSNYHLSETIYNLTNIDLGEEMNRRIQQALDQFFIDQGEDFISKYRYILDLKEYEIIDKDIHDIANKVKSELGDGGNIARGILDQVKNEFEKYLEKEKGLTPADIGLYTIFIDNKPLSAYKEYHDAVVESKKPKSKSKGKFRGVCSTCGSRENVSSDMTKTKIKFYTTNQLIFGSGISKNNYYKNMQMCMDCLFKYLAGENYIMNRLQTRLADFDVYIIPQFIYGQPLDEHDLDIATDRIVNSFNTVKSYQGIEGLRREIEGTLDLWNEESYFLLNFMFYRRSQRATKIQRLIKDVDPSIFERVSIASRKAKEDFRAVLGEKYRTTITLSTAYYMTPIRMSRGEVADYRDILETYDAIFTGRKLNRNHLIKNIGECIKIIRLTKDSYNINPREEVLEFYVMTANMYISFLRYMGCLEEGDGMAVSELNIRDNIKNYIEKVGYNEEETAMFLLGYLIGEIGNAQYRRTEGGNKPILNKLNFNGLDRQKIIRLTKDVFAKLNQEKIRQYNEVTFFEMKRLLDENIGQWKLNKDESLFYVLSGYSFATTIPMLKEKGDKKNDNNEQ